MKENISVIQELRMLYIEYQDYCIEHPQRINDLNGVYRATLENKILCSIIKSVEYLESILNKQPKSQKVAKEK